MPICGCCVAIHRVPGLIVTTSSIFSRKSVANVHVFVVLLLTGPQRRVCLPVSRRVTEASVFELQRAMTEHNGFLRVIVIVIALVLRGTVAQVCHRDSSCF